MASPSGSSPDSRDLLVLYATETGNAQDVADRIARQCRRISVKARVANMETYSPPDLISEELVVFAVSTTGSGVEPRAMTPLWNMLLRSDLPPDLFDHIQFAVFGLGDTAYEKFCWPAKKLSRRLKSLGAEEICNRGEGDDQHPLGLDGALDTWLDLLLKKLVHILPLPPGVVMVPSGSLHGPRVDVIEALTSSATDPLDSDDDYHKSTVKCNERTTADGWYQDVRHLEFTFEDDLEYSPGDAAVIHPVAHPDDVEEFLTSMGWGNFADTPSKIVQRENDQSFPDHVPSVITPRALFTRYLDFNAVPRRSFFQYLRYFTEDELEQERLDEFLSPEGADDLYEYCYRVRRTIREVLTEFRNVKIPKEYMFDVFPPLRPREFSIASSVKAHPRQIHLCVAIVKYRTKLKIPRRGVCTTYLAALRPGDTLKIGVKKGFIRLPPDNHTPVICVGPGTGIAPMRAIVQERAHDQSYSNTVYFGCRSATKDQHYKSEWEDLAAKKYLTYRAACSRDGPDGVKRTYVQDLIREDAERVWGLIGKEGAWVFISGSSNKMPASVREALSFSAEKYGGLTADDAKEYVSTMEREGRLIEECWS